jgi:hypothetical protein
MYHQNNHEFEVEGTNHTWGAASVQPNLPRACRQVEHLFKEGYTQVVVTLVEKSRKAEHVPSPALSGDSPTPATPEDAPVKEPDFIPA